MLQQTHQLFLAVYGVSLLEPPDNEFIVRYCIYPLVYLSQDTFQLSFLEKVPKYLDRRELLLLSNLIVLLQTSHCRRVTGSDLLTVCIELGYVGPSLLNQVVQRVIKSGLFCCPHSLVVYIGCANQIICTRTPFFSPVPFSTQTVFGVFIL